MKKLLTSLFLSALILVSGCAQLGVPPAQTFNENLVVGVASVTAVRTTATTLLQAGKISPDDAQNVQDQANNARSGLDLARAIARTNPQGAADKLSAVSAVLQTLQGYLATKGK